MKETINLLDIFEQAFEEFYAGFPRKDAISKEVLKAIFKAAFLAGAISGKLAIRLRENYNVSFTLG